MDPSCSTAKPLRRPAAGTSQEEVLSRSYFNAC
jgi:hypothetical protein